MASGPQFLDESRVSNMDEASCETHAESSQPTVAPGADDLPRGPVLLEAEPDAPTRLDIGWQPQRFAQPRSSPATAMWISGGIFVLLLTWIGFALARFMAALFRTSGGLGTIAAIAVAIGAGMIVYGVGREWRAYRSLAATERFRAVLSGTDADLDHVRAGALTWMHSVAPGALRDPSALERGLQSAESAAEIRALLRARVADRLQDASTQIGRRAALEGATAVAICPHPALDGLVVSLRGLVMIRQIAVLHGVRPGFFVTWSLIRKVAVAAAGTSGTAFLSQSFADHLLTNMPGIKHVAAALPEAGVAAFRLYRLAGITAKACCPI